MSQAKSKTRIITVAILATLVVAAGVLIPLYYFRWKPQTTEYPTWDLAFFGDTVDQSVNITYKEIREEFTPNEYHFNYTKIGYMSEIRNYTGIALWDLIEYSGVNYGRANALRFWGIDNYDSYILPIDAVQNNKSLIIIAYKEEGELLLSPEDGGEGYLKSAVNFSIDESTSSSKYCSKYLTRVEFLIDWDLSLYGEYVDEIKTISYNEILTSPNLTRFENTLINYTKLWDNGTIRSTELLNISGVTLWSVLNFTDVNYTTATGLNFTASDFTSYTVSMNWVEENASKILIVYAIDGELLDPESDGYLMSIVDYSLTEGFSSSKYKVRELSGIEFTLFL